MSKCKRRKKHCLCIVTLQPSPTSLFCNIDHRTSFYIFLFIYSLKPALESQWPPVCFSVWLHLLLASDSAERLGESTIAVSEWSWLRCKVCVWPLQDDLEQKWDIKMSATSKWFPPIKRPLLSPSIIISPISATLRRQSGGSCLHTVTDEIHFKFITSGLGRGRKKERKKEKKNISKSEKSFRKYQPHLCECK